ncbi:MAG TPA: acyl-CoA dehydratase activase-related protein [Dehalococcoidia bacterium]|nr:acyl-CoA dehydratase activase-related protein [Dehalococcoidia bacterium]
MQHSRVRVGIPRALYYFRYFPLAKAFFEHLGAEVVLSPPTGRRILTRGIACTMGDVCLPVKIYCGHVHDLMGEAAYIFVPSVRSVEPGLFNCVNLFALPDVIRAMVPGPTPILHCRLDVTAGPRALRAQGAACPGRCVRRSVACQDPGGGAAAGRRGRGRGSGCSPPVPFAPEGGPPGAGGHGPPMERRGPSG